MAKPHNDQDAYGAAARQARIQQAAQAALAEANTPEALAAEAKRQEQRLLDEAAQWRKEGREQCLRENRPIEPQYLEADEVSAIVQEASPPLEGGVDAVPGYPQPGQVTAHQARSSRLADKLAEVLEEELPEEAVVEPEPVMGGAHLCRWILVPADESDGWTLGFSMESHTSEEPAAVYLEVTQAMMRKWRNEPAAVHGLEKFAAGIMERVADSLAEDLTDGLIFALERITRGELREKQYLEGEPTRTSIGEDDPDAADIEGDFDLESGEPVDG